MKKLLQNLLLYLESTRRDHAWNDDDNWYTCPEHPTGCLNPKEKGCNCGANHYNKKLDHQIKLIKKALEKL